MNEISHTTAQQYLHLRREDLESSERQELDAHLFTCAQCRTYGSRIAVLEKDINHSFHNSIDLIPTPADIASKVQVRLDKTKSNRRGINLALRMAGALVLLTLLVFIAELLWESRLQPSSPSPVSENVLLTTEDIPTQVSSPSPASENALLTTEEVTSPAPILIPGGQLIAFTSRRDGNDEIYVMGADGKDQINLTNHAAADYLPTWSPDGQRLAFVSDRSGKPEVYLMFWDGTGLTQLTDLAEAEGYWSLSWSPDGTRLVAEVLFTYPVTSELYGKIFMIHADSSGVQALRENEIPIRLYAPQWSPTGDWIAYMQGGIAPPYLRLIQPDGTGDKVLMQTNRNILAFAWSSDGSYLAYLTSCHYCGNQDKEPNDLRLVSLDGSEEETLFRFEDQSLDFFGLSWSPDGSYLTLTARTGKEQILHQYLFDVEDKEIVDVMAFEPGDWQIGIPSWSPDSTRLVFDSGGTEEHDIYVLSLEARLQGEVGSGLTSLTSSISGMDYQPQWQP